MSLFTKFDPINNHQYFLRMSLQTRSNFNKEEYLLKKKLLMEIKEEIIEGVLHKTGSLHSMV